MSGELKKLLIETYKDAEFQQKDSDTFTVMFNPVSYSVKHEIEYNADQGIGTTGAALGFKKTKPQEIKLDFTLDGTGVSGKKESVDDQLNKFLKVAYEYQGDQHKPRYLKIAWGSLLMKCVMKNADVNCNLFKPDGTLLRAKVSATFVGFVEDNLRAAKENAKSPDLTHERLVKEEDNLPLLAFRIYGDPNYYLEVAKVNKLKNFRRIKTGTRILFPPIDKTALKTDNQS